jgi:hypothetical protein
VFHGENVISTPEDNTISNRREMFKHGRDKVMHNDFAFFYAYSSLRSDYGL